MHGAAFHCPYASTACTCIHRCTPVNPRTHEQLRTIRQVSWDVTPTSLGWRSSTGNTNAATESHPRAPAPTTEELRKPQIPQNQWKIWEKEKDFPWFSLGLIETVRFIRCRDWGRDCSNTGQLPTKQNTSAITSFLHISVSVPLRTCFLLFCILRFELSTVPQLTHCWILTLHRKSECW
jgi:hypothetical protein